jgi:hypothetical protein
VWQRASGRCRSFGIEQPCGAGFRANCPAKALDLLVILREKVRWILGENETEARDLTRALLGEIIATTRSIGAVPVFVYLPVYEEIEPLPKSSYPLTAMSPPVTDREQYLRGICQEWDIPCLFLRRRFEEEVKKGVDFNARGHWNMTAHRLAAQEIRAFLLQRNLIQNGSASDLRLKGHVVD